MIWINTGLRGLMEILGLIFPFVAPQQIEFCSLIGRVVPHTLLLTLEHPTPTIIPPLNVDASPIVLDIHV